MAIDLNSLHRARATMPPRIVIYGTPGIGKTTLGSEFPNAVFIQVEDGTPGDVELNTFGHLKTYDQVIEAIQALDTDAHDNMTVVLDSVTEMERLVFAKTCEVGDDKGVSKRNIEDFGYGKGYVFAERQWKHLMDGFDHLRRTRNMAIVLLAHSTVQKFDDPETQSYDQYAIDLHKRSRALIEQAADAIILLKKPVHIEVEENGFKERSRAKGADIPLMHTVGTPAFTAKNRYGFPPTVRYDRGKGFEALAPFLPTWAGPSASMPENTNQNEGANTAAEHKDAA